jgi:hypothetical protein
MDRVEKATALLERAEELGARVVFASGLNIFIKSATDDPARRSEVIAELVKYLPEVRSILQRRAVFAMARLHVGARIFSTEHLAGTLVGASEDGMLTISVSSEMRRSDEDESRYLQNSITANAETLIVIVDAEEVADATSSPNAEQVSEQPRRGLLDRLRRGSWKD